MLLQNLENNHFLKADGTLTDNEYEATRFPDKEIIEMCFNRSIPKGFKPVCEPEEYI